VSWAK